MAFFQNNQMGHCSCYNRFNLQYLVSIPKLNICSNIFFSIHTLHSAVCFNSPRHKFNKINVLLDIITIEFICFVFVYISQLGMLYLEKWFLKIFMESLFDEENYMKAPTEDIIYSLCKKLPSLSGLHHEP